MPLGDIHKKLYTTPDELEKRRLADDMFNPKKQAETANMPESQPDSDKPGLGFGPAKHQVPVGQDLVKTSREVWLSPDDVDDRPKDVKEQATTSEKKKVFKFGAIALGAVVVVVLAVVVLLKYQESAFSEEKVLLEVSGQQNIKSGEEVEYEISFTNKNRADLQQVVLKLNYSESFMLVDQPSLIKEGFNGARIDIGTLKTNETKKISVKAKTFGSNTNDIYMNASLFYQPDNFSSTFEKKAQLVGNIKSSLLKLSVLATKEAASGEEVELQVIINNEGAEAFQNVQLKMEYPDGFTYLRSEPKVSSENRTWDLGTVAAGQQTKIVINGTLEGSQDTVKTFKAVIGNNRPNADVLKLNETQALVKIISQRIVIEQTINGTKDYTANAGDMVEFVLKFKNNSDIALRDLVLSDKLTSPVLDKSSVIPSGGHYDSAVDTITWRASDIPSLKLLEPRQSGEVRFKAKITDKFPMTSDKDKNFVLTSQASLESLDLDTPLAQNKKVYSNTVQIKLNSKLVLNVIANYNDGELPNTGPVPMKVGQETTFTFRLNMMNTSNDLKQVVMSTSLPSGVVWKNKFLPQASSVEYNERTNELKWNVGTLSAGTGFISPVSTMAFQVGIVPSQNQVGHPVTLLNPIKVTGLDTFTGKPVEFTFQEIGSNNVSDILSGDGYVAQ